MPKKPYTVALLFALILLSACVNTDAVLLDPSQTYQPTESVQILFVEPTEPYEIIAIVEGNGSIFNNQSQVLKKIRKKAQKIGAHAIILLSTDSEYVAPTTVTNFDGSSLTVPGGKKLTMKAVAIRFN